MTAYCRSIRVNGKAHANDNVIGLYRDYIGV